MCVCVFVSLSAFKYLCVIYVFVCVGVCVLSILCVFLCVCEFVCVCFRFLIGISIKARKKIS